MHHHGQEHFQGKSGARYAKWVARWVHPPLYRAVASDLASVAPTGGAVLDVGTGPGRLLVEMGRRRFDLALAGVDPSEDMVALAKKDLPAELAGRTQVHVASAEELPFPEGSFDVVVSTLSGHHWRDPVRGLAEQARVLRPGGQVRVYDLRGPAAALKEHVESADVTLVPDAPTSLGWLTRLLVTCLVAVERPTDTTAA